MGLKSTPTYMRAPKERDTLSKVDNGGEFNKKVLHWWG